MKVINTGKSIEITADFDETAATVQGLRKALAEYQAADNWTMADELAIILDQVTNAEVKL